MDLTKDQFFGGKISLLQPKKGFRAGTDTVLLASAVKAKSGNQVLELGAGSGVALCCLGTRVSGLSLWALEVQKDIADIARQNLENLGLSGTVFTTSIANPPKTISAMNFDHVMMNPPYYSSRASTAPQVESRAISHQAFDDLGLWIAMARSRLKPQGELTIIHRANALQEILSHMAGFGAIEIVPIAPVFGAAAKNVLLRAVKGRATLPRLLAPVYARTESGTPHPIMEAITREGKSFWDLVK